MRTRREGCSHLRLKKSCHCRGSPERASWINSLPHPEVRPSFDTCRPHPEVRGRSPSLEGADAGSLRMRARASRERRKKGLSPQPGLSGALPRFVTVDGRRLLQREANVIQPVQKTVLAEGLDVEMKAPTIRAGDLLFLEIDGNDRIRAALGIVE